jgi:nitroreductase/formate hydrogenlyase subunit 6/NADH:ubiquinone oxidoreductase subunit I
MALIQVDLTKCEKEGICAEVCPIHVLTVDPKTGPHVQPGMGQYCIGCGHCVAACPHGALNNVRNPLAQHTPLSAYPALNAEKAYEFLRSRRSIRCYRDQAVPRELLEQLLQIARYAPSGHNSQGLSCVVVEGHDRLKGVCSVVVEWMGTVIETQPDLAAMLQLPAIVEAYHNGVDLILRGAPHLVLATADKGSRMAQVTTYLALEYVELYATSLGLGSCWAGYVQICAQQYPAFATSLHLPVDKMITGAMMVGYPKHTYYRLPERDQLPITWISDGN